MPRAKTICIMNNKGGCGKTTTAVAIGETWARLGKRILFIDLDSQSSLTSIITNTDPAVDSWDETIEDAFVGGPEYKLPIINQKEFQQKRGMEVTEAAELIDIVPADLTLCNIQEATASHQTREWMLGDILDAQVKDKYDYIIIDCPPALGLVACNAMVAADNLVIIVNADRMSYNGADMITQLYNTVIGNKRLNPQLYLTGVVITRYERNKISQEYLDKFKDSFKELVIEPVIRKSTKLVQAASFQRSIYDIDPTGKAAEDCKKVAMELLQRVEIRN